MRKILMKDTEQFRDTVSAKLCNCLYDACNEVLFKFTTPVMFSVHMNMRLEQDFFCPSNSSSFISAIWCMPLRN